MIDVVIPARNEIRTIGPVVVVLKAHPMVGRVIVVVDSDTRDATANLAYLAGASVRQPKGVRGKGQCVAYGLERVKTDRVMFFDADLTGLTSTHVSQMTKTQKGMVIGIPDIPHNFPMKRIQAWPWCSGQRTIPTRVARRLDLHGYLMETQINAAAHRAKLPLRFEHLQGLISPYEMTAKRLNEMERDREWGITHGILGNEKREAK
jgi:glycosyltransferase involved in cell wall biosynthesis